MTLRVDALSAQYYRIIFINRFSDFINEAPHCCFELFFYENRDDVIQYMACSYY